MCCLSWGTGRLWRMSRQNSTTHKRLCKYMQGRWKCLPRFKSTCQKPCLTKWSTGVLHTMNSDGELLLAGKGTGPKRWLGSLYLSYKLPKSEAIKDFHFKIGLHGQADKSLVMLCYGNEYKGQEKCRKKMSFVLATECFPLVNPPLVC